MPYLRGKVGRATGRRRGARRSVRVSRMSGSAARCSAVLSKAFSPAWVFAVDGVGFGMAWLHDKNSDHPRPAGSLAHRDARAKGRIASDWSSRQHVCEPGSAKPHGASPGFAWSRLRRRRKRSH